MMYTLKKKLFIISCICVFSLTAQAEIILTMDKALEYSEKNNPALIKSKMNMKQFEYNLKAQRASLKSRFSLDLSPVNYSQSRQFDQRLSQWYTNTNFSTSGTFRIDQPILWTDATLSLNNRLSWKNNESEVAGKTNTNRAFSNNLYLSLTQPLFTYNKTKMNLKDIELNYENALIGYALQKLNLEKNITNQFYNIFMQQNNLDISANELKNTEQSYEIIKSKVEADLVPKAELYQAELNLANARSSFNNKKVSLANAKDRFKQDLGIPLDEEIKVLTEINLNQVNIDLHKAIQSALSSRLELRQREIAREQLDMQLIQTKDRDSFGGQVSLSLGVTGDNEDLSQVYKHPTNNPQVAVSFSVPLFDWGARKARIRSKEIAIEKHDLDAAEELKTIEIDVRKTWRNLNNLLDQIEIAEQSVENAQRTYELNQEKYRNGELTGMDMNQFQNQLSSKKISYTQTLINYKIELLNLKIITLYDFENKNSIVPDVSSDIIK